MKRTRGEGTEKATWIDKPHSLPFTFIFIYSNGHFHFLFAVVWLLGPSLSFVLRSFRPKSVNQRRSVRLPEIAACRYDFCDERKRRISRFDDVGNVTRSSKKHMQAWRLLLTHRSSARNLLLYKKNVYNPHRVRTMATEHAGTHKDPITGEMISKTYASVSSHSLSFMLTIDETGNSNVAKNRERRMQRKQKRQLLLPRLPRRRSP